MAERKVVSSTNISVRLRKWWPEKITYSWRYDGYPGISFVSFELFEKGNKNKIEAHHTGLESFAASGPISERENFAEGWTRYWAVH
jgi:hypothetical protein